MSSLVWADTCGIYCALQYELPKLALVLLPRDMNKACRTDVTDVSQTLEHQQQADMQGLQTESRSACCAHQAESIACSCRPSILPVVKHITQKLSVMLAACADAGSVPNTGK